MTEYPYAAENDRKIVVTSPTACFRCVDEYEAKLALRALKAAFDAGQKSMLEARK